MRMMFRHGWAPPPWLAGLAASWLGVSMVMLASETWLGLAMLLVLPAWAIATLGVAALCVGVGVQRLDRGALLLAAGVVAATAALVAWCGTLATAGHWLRFQHHRAGYEAIAAEVQAGRLTGRPGGYGLSGGALGHAYYIDPRPPRRVAFRWDGIGDNWNGVVFDPTGFVEAPAARTADLFGGDLVGCRRLDRSWYHCGFT